MRNEHVRIDLIAGRFSRAGQAMDRHLRHHLLPAADGRAVMYLSWPIFPARLRNNEQSSNAGGLTVWPVRLLVPIGFFLLVIQGISELIKRIGFCRACVLTRPQAHKPTPKKNSRWPSRPKRENCDDRVHDRQHGADHLRFDGPLPARRLPGAFALAANGIFFGLIGIELGLLGPQLFQACRTASSAS
jgi:hypothetical protein